MTNFVGYKEMKGTSKRTGKDYHFIECHFLDDTPRDTRHTGYEVFTATLDGAFDIGKLNSMIGSNVTLIFGRTGSLEDINSL